MPIRGPKVLLACGCLVVLLAGTAGWWMIRERPKAGPYLDVLALEGDFVVAIRSETTRGRAFVEMVDGKQGLRWQALVPSYRVPDGAIGVAANDHAVTVRFPRDGRTQIFGFAPGTAQKLGTLILGNELAKEPDGHMSPDVATISAGPDAFEILEPDLGPTRVYEVSLLHGISSWHRDLPTRGVEGAWPTPAHLVIEQPGQVTVLDRDGAEQWSRAADEACVVDETLVVSSTDEVVAIALDDRAERSLGRGAFAGACGRHAGVLVIALDHPARLRFADGGELPLGGDGLATSPTFAGDLARYEPVMLADGRVIGVDLEARTIVWTIASEPGATLLPAGVVALLRQGELLASIDPRTGDAIAVRTPGTLPLRPQHVAGGGVWLIGERGLLELDVATLEPRGTFGKRPPEVTSAAVPWGSATR